MKRFSLVSLACAAALVICPVALVGQSWFSNFCAKETLAESWRRTRHRCTIDTG